MRGLVCEGGKYSRLAGVGLQVHITGKYGVRYGASLRKQIKKIEISQHAKYTCGCESLPFPLVCSRDKAACKLVHTQLQSARQKRSPWTEYLALNADGLRGQ